MGDHATFIALPVMGMEPRKDSWKAKPLQVYGTAFTIGGGAYLTAGHVWSGAQGDPLQALGMMDNPESGRFLFRKIREGELLPAFDLAVLKAPPFGKTFRWSAHPVSLLDEVRTFGYPFGFDVEMEMLNVRGFRGEIVGGQTITRLPGRPPGIELSFACPRGLSGARVISIAADPWRIAGVVVGNEITEMEVYREEEKLVEGGQEKVLIKTEALHLGLAIRADVVLKLESALLGCRIGEWLDRHGLLLS
jgi:hypothetical protein